MASSLLHDIRYAWRTLAKNPGFAAVAVLTLALGIGANTTIFTLLKGVVLRPLPGVRAADQLVTLTSVSRAGQMIVCAYPDYRDFRDRNTVFSSLAASAALPLAVRIDEKAERIWGELVSGNYFQMLGVNAELGRALTPDDDHTPGGHPVVVLSHALWKRRFASDTNVVGRTIHIGSRPFTIVGVAPPGFRGSIVGLSLQLFVPIMMQREVMPPNDLLEDRNSHWAVLLGRLKPGVALPQAQSAMAVLGEQISREYPNDYIRRRAFLLPLWKSPVGSQSILVPVLSVVMMLVGIVLIVVCTNVANLLLARAVARQREVAIRMAVGASRGRLVRQFLTESMLLSLLGGAVALLISLWSADRFNRLQLPTPFPAVLDAQFDSLVFAFALGVSVLAGVIFGLAPALQSSRVSLVPALKEESGGSFRASRLRRALLVAQVALSLVLLFSAGLVLQSRRNAQSLNPGFDPDNVLLFSMNLQGGGYDATRGVPFYPQLLDRVQSVPGVKSASLATFLPLLVIGAPSRTVEVEGYVPRPGEETSLHYNLVSSDYFRSLAIPLLQGRVFGPQDDAQSPNAVVVNDTLARRYWPGRNPVGRRLRTAGQWREVVGVVRDIKYITLTEPPEPYLYLPLTQNYTGEITVHVRAEGDMGVMQAAVESALRAADPDVPVFGVRSLRQHMVFSLSAYLLAEDLLSSAGLQVLLISAIGIYGVLSFNVRQRTREIGVRLALGAQRNDILRLVLAQGFRLTLLGIALGLLGALGAAPVLARLTYGVSARDPLLFACVAALLAGVALLATYLPARRASRVDPMVALRYE